MISGKTRVCGILAYPVEHSLSPLMQNFYAQQTGVDLEYVPFKVKPEMLGEAVRGAYALNITGLNVTVPHKQEVMQYLQEIDRDARAIGAVNTLVRMEGGYKGYNTDAAGLLRAMTEAGISIQGRTCILLGAGGAAKAAACVLAGAGAKKVYVLNRNRQRAEALAADVTAQYGQTEMVPMELADWRTIRETGCLAVQTTSVGMDPHVDQVIIGEPAFYEMLDTAVDLIYTPAETQFLKLARLAGVKTAVNGLDMLIYQGIIAFELWNPGLRVPDWVICEARALLTARLGGSEI